MKRRFAAKRLLLNPHWWVSGSRSPHEALFQTDEMHYIVANRHVGKSFFAITPSAEHPSRHNPTRNVGNHHIGQSRFANAPSGESVFWKMLRPTLELDATSQVFVVLESRDPQRTLRRGGGVRFSFP